MFEARLFRLSFAFGLVLATALPGWAQSPPPTNPAATKAAAQSAGASFVRASSLQAFRAKVPNQLVQPTQIGATLAPSLNLQAVLSANIAAKAKQPDFIRCMSPDRKKDSVGVSTTPEGTVISITCQSAVTDTRQMPGLRTVNFATASFGRGTVSTYVHDRAAACHKAFEAYRDNPAIVVFEVERRGMMVVCRTLDTPALVLKRNAVSQASTRLLTPDGMRGVSYPHLLPTAPKGGKAGQADQAMPKGLMKPGPSPALTALADKASSGNSAFLAYRINRHVDNVANWEYRNPFYRNDVGDVASIGLVTAQKVAVTHAFVLFFAGPPATPLSCANYLSAQGVIGSAAVKAKAYEIGAALPNDKNELDAIAAAGGPKGPKAVVTHFEITGKVLDEVKTKLPSGDGNATIRVLLGDFTAKNGFVGFDCKAAYGATLEVIYGQSQSQKATEQLTKDIGETQKKNAAAREAFEAELKRFKTPLVGKEALSVQVIGFVPPFENRGDVLVSQPLPETMTLGQKAPTHNYSLRRKVGTNGFYWPKQYQQNWTAYCRYSPGLMSQAIHDYNYVKKQIPADFFDQVVWALDTAAVAYDALKDVVVQVVAYITTVGECPVTLKYGDVPKKQPKACEIYKSGLGAGLSVAMSAVGLPPSIPSASGLLEQGATYAANYAVKYAVSKIGATETGAAIDAYATETFGDALWEGMSEKAKDAARDKLKSELVSSINAKSCIQTTPDGKFQDANKCLVTDGSVLNYSLRDEQLLDHDEYAVVWLRVNHNKAAAKTAKGEWLNPIVDVRINTTIADFGSANPDFKEWSAQWVKPGTKDSYLKPGNLHLFDPGIARIDARAVPEQGMDIPVVVPFASLDQWSWAAKSSGQCNTAFEASCAKGLALGGQRIMAFKFGKVNLSVGQSSTYTPDAALAAACKAIKNTPGPVVNCDKVDMGHVVLSREALNLSRPLPDLMEYVPTLAGPKAIMACPGFQTFINPEDGLPDIRLAFDPTDVKTHEFVNE